MKSWRSKAVRCAAWAAAPLVLASCAGQMHGRHGAIAAPEPPPAGALTPAAGSNPAPPVATAQAGAARFNAAHRQYFDQRRHRYYYFDPARRAYFWEDGSPKT